MAKVSDIISSLPLRAQGLNASQIVRILNTEIREDLRDLLYSAFDETYRKTFVANINKPIALTSQASSVSGSVDEGEYRYKVSFVTPVGETRMGKPSEVVSISNSSTAGKILLTYIPLGSTGTTARKIYRQKNGSGNYNLITTISDNTTTTYTDNTDQASVGARGVEGFDLPSDFYEIIPHPTISGSIPLIRRKRSDNYSGTKNYYWIDYRDNPDGTSSSVFGIPDDFAYSGTVNVQYRPIIEDADDINNLPYPLSLHGKLLPVLTLGVAFYHLSELIGEETEMLKMQGRYEALKTNVFGYSTSY